MSFKKDRTYCASSILLCFHLHDSKTTQRFPQTQPQTSPSRRSLGRTSTARGAPPSASTSSVGAGIGGLAAAHTLAHAGNRITLLELARELHDVGAGIQVSPNASRLLHRWGLSPAMAA